MTKKELFLSEDQARRLWERAAQLQSDAAEREKAAEGDPGSRGSRRELLSGVEDESTGYSLTHVREAGQEIGIRPDFLDLALAEEAILELEGGGRNGFWDKTSEKFLKDKGRVFEVRRRFSLPARRVWLGLEEALTSETHGVDLLGFRGGNPDEGGIALFESPYSYTKSGSLQYWATVAEVRRFMVRVTPEDDGGCVVLISAPLRRSRRVNGVVGMIVSGVGGALGGGLMLGLAASVVGTGGAAALPIIIGGAAAGVLGGERFTGWGYVQLYRSGFRSLKKAFQRILTRVERDVRRTLESPGQPGQGALPPPDR